MVAFSDKFVAFVDVLGFKKLVADAESGVGLPLGDLLQLLGHLGTGEEREMYERVGPKTCPHAPRIDRNLDFRVTQISDCVIASAEISPAGAINLVAHCWGAVIELLVRGIMCRGYIKRGSIYHSERQVIGSGYQDAYLAESAVDAFKREAEERGTPYVQVDAEVGRYVEAQTDACVKMMFERFVKRDGDAIVLFPFQRLAHQFSIRPFEKFDEEAELRAIDQIRQNIALIKKSVWSYVDQSRPDAIGKASHYLGALDAQLLVCDKTEEWIRRMVQKPQG